MIQMQDVTVFDLPVETKAYEQRIVMQNRNADFSSYTIAYTPKKPEIVKPQTSYISPMVMHVSERLKNGTLKEQESSIRTILNSLDSSTGAQFLDKGINDALFAIVDSDLSQYKGPTWSQKRLRNKHYQGKKLTKEQAKKAFELSDRERAEVNKGLALTAIAESQNLLFREVYRRTGLKPSFKDLPAVDKIVYEAKNNQSEYVKIAALNALGYLYRPEYLDDLSATFSDIAKTTKSDTIRKQAQGGIDMLEKEKAKLNK